ncbi:hypothetical protein DVK02_11520 [Halobellus sp. Atlit-31R]|nr:hypothetical protein DVK02_11520 [Halobellus sp. Atlit-31R]
MSMRTTPGQPWFKLRWLIDPRRPRVDWLHADEWVPSGSRHLYEWAKQGLEATFETLEPGSTVLLPSYVPGGVTWAALTAGLDVRYYPVAKDLTLPTAEVAERIRTVDPDAVQFVHYFGFVDESLDELVSVARARSALVIEDCARGLFARDRQGRLLGSVGDVALYSLHKTLPVPDGGLLVSRREPLSKPRASPAKLRSAARHVVGSVLARSPVSTGSDRQIGRSAEQSVDAVAPARNRAEPGALTRRGLARCDPDVVRSKRQGRYRALRELLVDCDRVRVLSGDLHEGACPFGVAALAGSAAERAEIFRALRDADLPCEVLTWPPVHRHRAAREFTGARVLRSRLLVLPTHQQLSPAAIGRMAAHVSGESPPDTGSGADV